MTSIRESVAHVQKHIKAILRQLRPAGLLDFGLRAAIGDLVAFWSRRDPSMEFRVQIAVEDASLDRRTAEVAYRVVQESVSNAIRHGRPAAIVIAITPLAQAVCVRVCDDGEGLGSTEGRNRTGGHDGTRARPGRKLGRRDRVRWTRRLRHGDPAAPRESRRMKRILVVDDHAIVRAGCAAIAGIAAADRTEEAESGEAALAMIGRTPFQLLILDLNLPGLGGPELLRRLLKASPDLPVLVFSMIAEPVYVDRALQAGARGYVSKNAAPEELLKAIHAVMAGQSYVEQELALELNAQSLDETYLRPLTNRDLEIMRLLAQGRSLTQIAQTLGVAYKTVANTCSLIKEKLGLTSTADLIRLSIDRGLG